jgi:hypothetical protein
MSGAMRRDELTKMSIHDIKDEHSVLIVAVPDTKTGIKRTFTVTNPEFVRLYRKYAALVSCTHPKLKNIINCAVSHLKPEKSKQQYKKCYSDLETDVTRRM